jgi:hypothetical protein
MRRREAGALGKVTRCQLTSASWTTAITFVLRGRSAAAASPCASSSMPSPLVA